MNNKGAALATVLLLSLLLMILLVSFISIALKEMDISINDQYSSQAFYLAEAGTEIGIRHLYRQPDFRGELLGSALYEKPLTIQNGQITSIKLKDDSHRIKIISVGEVKGVSRKVTVTVKVIIIILEEEDSQEVVIDYLDWEYDI